MPTSSESHMRRFVLVRTDDVSGTSGVGTVAEGVEYSNGWCSLHWLTQLSSFAMYENVKTLVAIHGHENRTQVQWIDP